MKSKLSLFQQTERNMAYITADTVKEMRKELKATFPDLKLSVTRENHSSVNVFIMEAPVKFTDRSYEQLNPFYLDRYQNSDILEKIREICNRGNYNKSDSQTDYFEVGHYFNLSIGKWDKPFKLTA